MIRWADECLRKCVCDWLILWFCVFINEWLCSWVSDFAWWVWVHLLCEFLFSYFVIAFLVRDCLCERHFTSWRSNWVIAFWRWALQSWFFERPKVRLCDNERMGLLGECVSESTNSTGGSGLERMYQLASEWASGLVDELAGHWVTGWIIASRR